jgi:hypothetical protein
VLKNKGIIVDIIKPHECDSSQIENITDSDKPTKESFVSPTPRPEEDLECRPNIMNPDDFNMTDARAAEHKKKEPTSTAPSVLLERILK